MNHCGLRPGLLGTQWASHGSSRSRSPRRSLWDRDRRLPLSAGPPPHPPETSSWDLAGPLRWGSGPHPHPRLACPSGQRASGLGTALGRLPPHPSCICPLPWGCALQGSSLRLMTCDNALWREQVGLIAPAQTWWVAGGAAGPRGAESPSWPPPGPLTSEQSGRWGMAAGLGSCI